MEAAQDPPKHATKTSDGDLRQAWSLTGDAEMTSEAQKTDSSSPRWVLQMPSTSTYPRLRPGAKRRYTPEQFQSALKAVCEEGLTPRQAANLYHVPKSTLWHHLCAGRPSTSSSSSPSAKARKSAYSLRHSSGPADSTRRPRKSHYFFRQQPSFKQNSQASCSEKRPLTKQGKSPATPQVIDQRSAVDASRRKVGGRSRDRSGIVVGGGDVCCFCGSAEDNTVRLGQMCVLREFRVHYFCLLFSSGLPQNGEDDEGILGFLEEDIKAEIVRGRKLSCSYCFKKGATIGCVEKKCKRKYHFPCGIRNNALCMFSNDYRSYCSHHREYQSGVGVGLSHECPICMEQLVADPKQAVWAPCCQRNSWFHKQCLQMLALNAGYFFKCPLCNDTQTFLPEMRKQGIYVPEQDASWELEPNAFSELLERPTSCDAAKCCCPDGRKADRDRTWWEVLLCSMCGSTGTHIRCGGLPLSATRWTCHDCTPTTTSRESTPASNTAPMTTRYHTRRAREAGDVGSGGDDDVSPKKMRLEQTPDPNKSRVEKEKEEEEEEEDDGTVPLDTVLLELEELGEEVPAALQRLKERVRLVQARMKELRLTEGEVVRAAQRMSASLSSGSGQEPQASVESTLPHSKATQLVPIVQVPKLALSRNHTLPDKTQLTLVAMMQSPAPTPSTMAQPAEKQNNSPPHQVFPLDKAHLLAFWRCALPLGRMKEVLNVLEAVFTQREAQAAKAALALASRRRPSPRTAPEGRRMRAMHCTTPTTSWQGWSAGNTPVTPRSTDNPPTTPQSSSGQFSTLHHPSTPSSASHHSTPHSEQPMSLSSESCQQRTPQADPQNQSLPITGSPYPSTPSDVDHPSSPCSNLSQPETLCTESSSCAAQRLNVSPRLCPSLIEEERDSRHLQPPVYAKNGFTEDSSPTTCSASHATTTEESLGARSACRRLLLQPSIVDNTNGSTNTDKSKASSEDAQESIDTSRQATPDTTSDRKPAPPPATMTEDFTTNNDSNNNNKSKSNNKDKAITKNDTDINTNTNSTTHNTSTLTTSNANTIIKDPTTNTATTTGNDPTNTTTINTNTPTTTTTSNNNTSTNTNHLATAPTTTTKIDTNTTNTLTATTTGNDITINTNTSTTPNTNMNNTTNTKTTTTTTASITPNTNTTRNDTTNTGTKTITGANNLPTTTTRNDNTNTTATPTTTTTTTTITTPATIATTSYKREKENWKKIKRQKQKRKRKQGPQNHIMKVVLQRKNLSNSESNAVLPTPLKNNRPLAGARSFKTAPSHPCTLPPFRPVPSSTPLGHHPHIPHPYPHPPSHHLSRSRPLLSSFVGHCPSRLYYRLTPPVLPPHSFPPPIPNVRCHTPLPPAPPQQYHVLPPFPPPPVPHLQFHQPLSPYQLNLPPHLAHSSARWF